MDNTIEKIVENVLIQNRIRNYNKKDLELQLQIHPNYPSFQSITDTLDYFSIDNIAVEVPIDALDQLPNSFISLIKTDGIEEIVTVNKKNNFINLKHSSLKKKKLSLNEFKEIWVPKVIAVEYNTKHSVVSNTSIIQNILFTGLFISLIFILIEKSWGVNQILFLLLSLAGVVFSFFAVRESLGIQSQTIHQFCTSIGNTNCGDVINNNSGILFKNFSLADAGMAFFGSITLYQIFYGYSNVLLISSLAGIPFILYSIYSQAFIIKKWCVICLGIASISLTLAGIAILNFPFDLDFSKTIPSFIMVSSLFTLAYLYSKEKIKDNNLFKSENLKLNQFKRDEEIYTYLMNTSEKIKETITIPNEIILGNPNATFKITSITNPMCGHCKKAFKAYTRVIRSMGDQLKIVIRLSVNTDDLDNKSTQIALKLLEIYHEQGTNKFIDAYTDWFTDKAHSKWLKEHGLPKNNLNDLDILKNQSEWAKANQLYYTPTSIIGNTIYPQKYGYDEFFHFISVMIEKKSNYILEENEQPIEI
ncbi:vitamin K epoxide reductase family protein [Aquimarina muelleri]|uniref:Vitamin K epoxide reductase domain-containing protein n=1 Tax=Aquimarina muelleri TaxID=279356 RepID=A0A918JV29_9FLAO|nr:vitamin K epoxide reductase family protein [Aquimarina muelleri]MCX2761366.1 thioredoxin domain-containing protein [Aquimarina muelleri]GGX13114.1 hypothetical protein GCM10007384_13380 [Aquimarina muelleri]